MPNEFVARNGFISKNNSVITGSLTATLGITGSALSASYSISSSYSITTISSSYSISAISSSLSTTAATSGFSTTASTWAYPSYMPTVNIGYITPQIAYGEITGSIGSRPGNNNILVTPFTVYRDCTLDGLMISFCSSGSGIPTTCSLGIYSDNGNCLPSNRLISLGTAATNSSSLFQHHLISANPLTTISLKAKNLYWVAIVGDGGLVLPIVSGSLPNTLHNPVLGVELSGSGIVGGLYPTFKVISSYGFVSASAGNPAIGLPASMPSTTNSYTVNSYFTQSAYILPLISVIYG